VFAQVSAGSISGVVQDATGAVIPGAQVIATNNDQGVQTGQTITNELGIFTFSALPAANYTLTVELPGFKKYEQKDIRLFVNDKLGLPPIVLEVGSANETVTVEADAVQLQTVTAERSGVVTGRQILDIALNGRNFTSLFRTVPGAPADAGTGTTTFNGQRASQNNFMVDGQTVTDSGVNQQFAYRVSMDAIAEFKVSTNSQGAEFGRNSGAQVQVATKSGTQDFHGGGYFFKRHEGWNANSFDNNRRGVPRQIYRFMTAGYNVGGPIYIPNHFNSNKEKLFFFMSHEWGRQKVPPAPRRITVPTEAERRGDFSASRDSAGIPVTVIDPVTRQPFLNNRIPPERFNVHGPSVLNWLPLPNVFGNPQYNYESQVAQDLPSFDQVYRVDYNISSNWRLFGRVLSSRQTQNNPYGRADSANNLGISPLSAPTFGDSVSVNLITILNPTTTNELQVGWTKNGIPGDAPPTDSPYYRSNSNITIPLLYPNADPIQLVPNFAFDIASNTNNRFMTSFAGLPYANKNPIWNVTDNVSKVFSAHTLKAGIFVEHAVKSENPFRPLNANIDFQRDSNNPNDAGWAFANALLGNFREYSQFSRNLLPSYPYWNIEWYAQDTWRATSKLTVNYGLRFNVVPPLWEKDDLLTTFDPEAYDPARRVTLYQPVRVNNVRLAQNPRTGETLPATFIGAIVPGSGAIDNGVVRANQNGVPRGLIESRGLQLGPRFGLAYAMSPKTVFRLGGGLFYERISTASIGYTTNYLTNPPDVQLSQINFGNLSTIASSVGTALPLQITQLSRDGHLPMTANFSAGLQRELPFSMLLDVSYVGTQSRHLTETNPFNVLPFGSAWLPENQDPTLGRPVAFDGTTTLPANLYRPFIGYSGGNVTQGGAGSALTNYTFGGSSNYNALQLSVNRRAGIGLNYGASYTWSRALGTTGGHPTNHRAANYGLLSLDRSHGLSLNYIYDIPSLAQKISALDNGFGRQVFGGWQLSGLTSMSVGAPLTLDYTLTTIQNPERNRRITGSEDIGPRIVLTCDPNLPRGERTILRFIDTSCVAPAPRGSTGMDSGINTVRGPGINNWDISLFKRFQMDESRYLQLRVEMFNAFNHTQWGTFNSVAQFNLNTGQLVNAASETNRDGFGALTAARANSQRIIQLAAKFYF
jgi:hypothetical protein